MCYKHSIKSLKSFLVLMIFFFVKHVFMILKTYSDTSLFTYNKNGFIRYILAYVDDVLYIGNNDLFLSQFVNKLANKLSLKDLGDLLNVKVVLT